MANVNSDNWLNPARKPSPGKPFVCRGRITATPATGDVWRWFKVAQDTRLVGAWYRNTLGGTDVPGTIVDNQDSPVTYVADIVGESAHGYAQISTGVGTVYTAKTEITTVLGTVDTGAEMTMEVIFMLENL